ncbi:MULTISPECIES: response regulator [unclassified Methylobacterium]|uniref:response regulator n=1 Tax=unclassified Methylobacterium TaxID=2615210 RepID=UPI0006F59F6E|nr:MULTISPECIES: response regulator [unclassified Methylobacterium]KQO60629.1 response regulator [Methylobacterium sp. Leaf86]KQO86427.1 response regulator [Methylobacterium sp. Leaf91]MBO1018607.1 response regulator [Methylobacterium sp. SD274]
MSEPLRIVVVEDEALIVMQLEMLLEEAGHEVVGTAVSASDAIAVARRTRPDIVLIDLQLKGGSSGLDVARNLADEPTMTLVFLTANASRFHDDFAGAVAVIAKPFSEAVIGDTMIFLEECIRTPPPVTTLPLGLRLAPGYLASLGA